MQMPDKSKTVPGESGQGRRIFMQVGLACLGVSVIASLAGTVRFFFPKVLFEPQSVFLAGKPGEYRPGEVSLRFKETDRVWIVKTLAGALYALEANCTHLGCTPQWFAENNRFQCPCHGTNFDVAGDVLAGPAPVPLYRVSIQLDGKGRLRIDKRLKENRPDHRDQPPFILFPEERKT
jgi:cytochrome b6-f complex iron-sulfur subunit